MWDTHFLQTSYLLLNRNAPFSMIYRELYLLCETNTGPLPLREKRSGYIGVHVHQVPAFFKYLFMVW